MRAPVPPLQRELQGRWEGGVRAAVAVGLVAEGGYLHHPRPRILARFENQLFWCVGFIDRQKIIRTAAHRSILSLCACV
jgi:hypothetical protein